ncbi:MAG TPA: hypothetical protein VFG22_16775 [Polyangiales bacterium]|nr:hypothetical protein [Polyangiales bacterium]
MRRIEVKRRVLVAQDWEGPFHYDPRVRRLGSIFLLGVAACASPAMRTVPRVVDGEVENGPFVSPYAYEWFIEGEALAAKGQHAQAAIAFENAAAAPDDDVLLMTRLAEEYELSGAYRRADRTLSLARRNDPSSARVALAEGRILQSRGAEAEALSSFARAMDLAPAWEEPVIEMAVSLNALGHPQRANAVLLDYVENSIASRSASARKFLLELAREAKDGRLYERALLLDSSSTAESRAEAAGALSLEAGRPAMAARILGRALDSTKNTNLWIRALSQSGDRARALDFLAESQSDQVEGDVWRAEWLVRLGDAQRALDSLQAMSGSPRVELSRGEALAARGEYASAAAVLSRIPFGASTFEASRLALVECSTSLGRAGAATEALSQAPHGSLSVRAKVAEFYLEEGDLPAALRLFDPKNPKERALIARLFEEAGEFREAAAYYASLKPSFTDGSPLAARASAERLAAHGHLGRAVSVLEGWRTAAPDDLYARVRLVELLLAQSRRNDAMREGRDALGLIEDQMLSAHLSDLLTAQSNLSR